jgi:phosphoglycolate phosphatase
MKGEQQDWPRAVVFDLDGTLADSAPDIAHALNCAMEKRGLALFPVETVKLMIGGGISKLIERAAQARRIPGEEIPPIAADFVRFYRESLTTQTLPFEGARELLAMLVSEGRRLGVCTNKRQDLTLEILKNLDLAKYFQAVRGAIDGRPRKPDAAPLLEVLSSLQVHPSCAVMVGDSEADVGCARAAGVPAVAVSFGYSKVAANALGADAVIDRLGDLPSVFPEINPR